MITKYPNDDAIPVQRCREAKTRQKTKGEPLHFGAEAPLSLSFSLTAHNFPINLLKKFQSSMPPPCVVTFLSISQSFCFIQLAQSACAAIGIVSYELTITQENIIVKCLFI